MPFGILLVLFATATLAGYALIFYCEYKVLRTVSFIGPLTNARSRRMQLDLHRALLALAFAPLITVIIPGSIYTTGIILHIDMGGISPFIVFCTSKITLINPLSTFYFIRPFRRGLLGLFRCRNPRTFYSSAIQVMAIKLRTTGS